MNRIEQLNELGIRAADNTSAETLARLAAGEVKTGLVVLSGGPESRAREAAFLIAFPSSIVAEMLEGDPCFSTSAAAADGRELEVVDLTVPNAEAAEDLGCSITEAMSQAKPKLVVVIEAGEPVEIPEEAGVLRVRLDPAAELQAAS